MRYRIFILFTILLCSRNVNGQVTDTQLRVRADQDPDSLLIMTNDTNNLSPYFKTGKWRKASDVIGSVAGDTDWLKLGTTLIPTNSDSAYRSGYTLFKGLYGGLATKIEMLKDGILQFDYTNESSGETKVYQIVKPLQQSEGNVPWVSSIFTAANYGDRWNDVHSMGWNLEGGNVLEAGKHAFGHVTEGFYQQDATHLRLEDHTIYYGTDGVQRRPESLIITDGIESEWYKYFTVNDMFGLDPITNYKSFQFSIADPQVSQLYLWTPQSANTKAASFEFNTATNRLSISPIGTSNTTFDVNAFPFTRAALIQRTEVASTYGLTMATIAGNTSDGYFGNITPGWGLTLASDILKADTSKLATQYDLTLVSGGATDLTIGGSGPDYTIESSTGTDVTVSAGIGIELQESPANTLVVTNAGVVQIENVSDATSHTFFAEDATSSVIGSLKLVEGTGVTLTTSGTTADGIITIATTITDTDTRTTIEEDDSTVESNAVTLNFSTGLDAQESPSTQVNVNLDFGEFPQDATMEGDEEVLVWDTGASIEERVPVAQFDQSTTNEIQTLDVSGTGPTITFDLSSDVSDPTITGAGITAITASGNAITVTSTEVDGSTTNEAWTIDADLGDTEVISNQIVLMSGDSGIVTTYTASTNTWTADIRGDEFTTVTTPESTDYLLMHDENGSSADVIEKILWSDITMDIISFYDGTVLQGTGNAIDVGEGIDINMAGNEANINLDASEFLLDGTNETDESFIVYDPDETAGHRIQRIPWSDVVGGSDTNFAEDNLTWTGNRTHNESTYTTTIQGSAMAWKFEDIDATAGPSITLEGNIGNSDAPFGSIAFQYSDSGFATDQAAWTMVANRETNDQEHSTLEITANEATAAPPVIVFEENQNLSDNTQETFIQLNGGIAKTQYWESATSNAITLDRGYYNVALLSGHTGTITLPEIYGINEANTEVSATLVPIGQEYVITNLSGSSVTIAAINNTGTANDDWLNNTEAGTYSLANGNSIIVKATTIVSNEGHWFIY